MPTIEISKKDLEQLLGKRISLKELEDLLMVVKGEIEGTEEDIIKVDIKDINRPDLWSTTGIARELRGELGKARGLVKFKVEPSNYKVFVDPALKDIRPLTVCAVVKDLILNEEAIKQLIDLQERLSENFGRQRKEAAIGIYDADKIKWPIYYKSADPDKTSFIPLDMDRKLTLRKILSLHEKGRKYGRLLEGKKKFPIFVDSSNQILSMPPIINSNYSGKITEKTKKAFIEVSGFSFRFIAPCLLVMVAELADRGAKVERVTIHYKNKKIVMPDFKSKKMKVSIEYCNKILGLNLSGKEIKRLLEKRRHDVRIRQDFIEIAFAPYRQDIIHVRDIVEEIAISYGYNNITPEYAKIAFLGKEMEGSKIERRIVKLLAGLNMQEIATFTMTNKDEQFKKMKLNEKKIVEIINPVSKLNSIMRIWLIPSLLSFLEKNKKARYPQRIFEIGTCIEIERGKAKDIRKIAIAVSHARANYTEVRQIIEYLLRNFGLECKIEETVHSSFIEGRVGKIVVKGKNVGIIGEIHPIVLENFSLRMPVSVVEIDLSELVRMMSKDDE